jgi:hypothetical protein
MTLEKAKAIIADADANWEYEAWDFASYHNSGNQRFLNTRNGQYVDTSVEEYNANVASYVQRDLMPELYDIITAGGLSQDDITRMQYSNDVGTLAFLDYLASDEIGALVKDSKGNFILNGEAGKNGMIDLNGITFDGLEPFFMNKFLITDPRELYSLIGSAVATQEGQRYQRAADLEQEGQQFLSDKQEDYNLIEKARTALLSGEELEDALTRAEQKRLKELIGVSDLTEISMMDLNSATVSLTSTMVSAADELNILVARIRRGEIESYETDPDTGEITGVTVNYSYLANPDTAGYYTVGEDALEEIE